MHRNRTLALALGGLTALALASSQVLVTSAATATTTVTAGSLAFVSTPPNVSFSATLSGVDQAPTSVQAIDVGDATGSGAGWNITATSTTFAAGPTKLATSATTVAGAPSVACDASVTCTVATNAISYPYTLPAATTAPLATKVYNSAANTGMGNQTVTPSWKVALPANTIAGTYTSTWTISLVSAP
jgi:hypothetical protein